jgi:hypothetical protein
MGNQQWNNVKNKLDLSIMSYDLGYVIGVYLGDGWIHTRKDDRSKQIGLSVIDKDFAEKFRCSVRAIGGSDREVTWRERDTEIGGKKYHRKMFEYVLGFTELCNWLLNTFKKKEHIPSWICASTTPMKFKHGVLEGALDSEGWFSTYIRPDLKKPLYRLGFACTKKNLVLTVKTLAQQVNISVTGPNKTILKSGKILETIWLNKYDFVRSPLKFNIRRKQDRVIKFAKEYDIRPSETEHQGQVKA